MATHFMNNKSLIRVEAPDNHRVGRQYPKQGADRTYIFLNEKFRDLVSGEYDINYLNVTEVPINSFEI
jgi:hypothetical protein